MKIVEDISIFDINHVFLDIENNELVYKMTCQPRLDCKKNRDQGFPESILYKTGENPPPSQIDVVNDFTVDYALVQNQISNEYCGDEESDKIYSDSELPTEPTLKEYIEKLRSKNKYLVIIK